VVSWFCGELPVDRTKDGADEMKSIPNSKDMVCIQNRLMVLRWRYYWSKQGEQMRGECCNGLNRDQVVQTICSLG